MISNEARRKEVEDLINQTRATLALRLIVQDSDPKFYEVRNHADVFKVIQKLAQEALGPYLRRSSPRRRPRKVGKTGVK